MRAVSPTYTTHPDFITIVNYNNSYSIVSTETMFQATQRTHSESKKWENVQI
jgi:hypothetical protein